VGAKPFPTLGPWVCDWIERNCVFGPGDRLGQPAELDDETRALIYRCYEVYPQKHEKAGRRRFRRAAFSQRKGTAKTEKLAWLAYCELDATSPVRCVGWTKKGDPIGGPVTDPYIPLVAYTEEQSDELAYGALRHIIQRSPRANHYDVGLDRIMRKDGSGKAVSLASSPSARDGARTTFQGFDETHRFTLPSLKKAHRTMIANLPKRFLADAWSLEITTAFGPGEGSVAEDTMEYARQVEAGAKRDATLFFFHRQAGEDIQIYNDDNTVNAKELKRAVLEASGPVAAWSDIDGITEQWNDPTADRPFLERVWLNRLVRATDRAFDGEQWRKLARMDYVVPDGAVIVLGFDGSRVDDSTALIAQEVESGFQWGLGLWERPAAAGATHVQQDWQVPEEEVNEAVRAAFERYDVWALYGDPPQWTTQMGLWAGEYEGRVKEFWTKHWDKMSEACKAYRNAMQTKDISHGPNGKTERDIEQHKAFCRHIGNAHRLLLRSKDEDQQQRWVIVKERKGSPMKVDAAVAGAICNAARSAALGDGANRDQSSVYDQRAKDPEGEMLRWV
jgi:hypothetical protein